MKSYRKLIASEREKWVFSRLSNPKCSAINTHTYKQHQMSKCVQQVVCVHGCKARRKRRRRKEGGGGGPGGGVVDLRSVRDTGGLEGDHDEVETM